VIRLAHSAGAVHIADWFRTGNALAPVYALGPGVDASRPLAKTNLECAAAYRERRRAARLAAKVADENAPVEAVEAVEPVVPNPPTIAKEPAMSEFALEYHEIPEMPGVKRFTCDRLRSTLSVSTCAERWENANGPDPDHRTRACLKCPIGVLHTGKTDMNMSMWKGSKRCARCGEGASRLVGGHLCLSDYNRQREVIKGANGKGTKPKLHPPLHRRSVSYLTNGEVKTKTIEHTIGLEEVMFSVLRVEEKTVKFGFRNTAMDWLRGEEFDRSISDADEDDAQEAPQVSDDSQDVDGDAELEAGESDEPADPYAALRAALECSDRPMGAGAPSISRISAKKARHRARHQARRVRVSSVTVGMLQSIGALPPATPLPVPARASESAKVWPTPFAA
jgi:hypothetical protein